MSVQFEDFSLQVIAALDDATIAYLKEAGGELEAQVKRNTRVAKGAANTGASTKNAWKHIVDTAKGETIVGNPLINAVYEEFGTGDFADKGKGRKGGWWIPVGNGANQMSPKVAKAYKWEKVKKDKDGNITYVFTRGKEPTRALQRAFNALKNPLIKKAEQVIGGKMK